MKKALRNIFVVLLSLIMIMPITAFAEEESIAEWNDIELSDEEIKEILDPYIVDNSYARTSGLITIYGIGIKKDGTSLLIAGKTYCAPGVIKSGFTEVVVQRRKNSNYSWAQYAKYTDLYNNATGYVLTKELKPPTGYQYRVTCVHYAKKSLLSTEKISNISNIVTM